MYEALAQKECVSIMDRRLAVVLLLPLGARAPDRRQLPPGRLRRRPAPDAAVSRRRQAEPLHGPQDLTQHDHASSHVGARGAGPARLPRRRRRPLATSYASFLSRGLPDLRQRRDVLLGRLARHRRIEPARLPAGDGRRRSRVPGRGHTIRRRQGPAASRQCTAKGGTDEQLFLETVPRSTGS